MCDTTCVRVCSRGMAQYIPTHTHAPPTRRDLSFAPCTIHLLVHIYEVLVHRRGVSVCRFRSRGRYKVRDVSQAEHGRGGLLTRHESARLDFRAEFRHIFCLLTAGQYCSLCLRFDTRTTVLLDTVPAHSSILPIPGLWRRAAGLLAGHAGSA